MSSFVGIRARSSSVHTGSLAPLELAPIVSGVHLKRDFQLACTIQPPDDPEGPTRVANRQRSRTSHGNDDATFAYKICLQ